MGCEVCQTTLSGLAGGVVSLVYFILNPLLQITVSLIKSAVNKISSKL